MSAELYGFLKSFPILEEHEIQLIIDSSNVQEFKKGTFLLKEGEVASKCYLVLRGAVREFFYKDGEEKSTAFYLEGDPVNSFTSSSTGVPSKHNIVCMEDCLLTVSNQAMEEEMCRLIPRLESIIRQEVEKNIGKAQDQLAKFISSSPEERYEDLVKSRPDLINRIPQHQIASYIGVKPESLSRIRKRMMDKKQ